LDLIFRVAGWICLSAAILFVVLPVVDATVNWKRDFIARGKVTHKSIVPRDGLYPEEYIVTVQTPMDSFAVAVSSSQFREVEVGDVKSVYETSGVYAEPMGME
jgi:hypothetical protein